MKENLTIALLGVQGLILAGMLAGIIMLAVRVGEQPTREEFNQLRAEISAEMRDLRIELLAEIRNSNAELLHALANHTHDEDGAAVFALPPGVAPLAPGN